MTRRLCLVLTLLAVIAAPRARAAEAGAPLNLAVAWALDDLERDERRFLAAFARESREKKPDERLEDRLERSLGSFWRTDLKRVLGKLTVSRGWQLAAIAQLVPPEVFEPSERRRTITDVLVELGRGLSDGRCPAIAGALSAFIDGGLNAPMPLTREALKQARQGKGKKRCLEPMPDGEPDPLEGHVLLAVSARSSSDVIAVVSGLGTREPEYFRIGSETSYAPGKPTDESPRVFFTAVPADLPVTLRVVDERFELPVLVDDTPDSDRPFVIKPPRAACLRLDIKRRAGDVILLDGWPMEPGLVSVPAEAHDVVVLHRNVSNDSYRVVAAQRVEEKQLIESRCFRVSLDLSPPAGGRGAHQVSIVSAQADAGCAAAGLDSAAVKLYAEEALSRPDVELKPFAEFKSTIDRVTSIKDALSSLPGRALGAPRGAGTMAALGVAAAELLRQDFGTPISVEVSCRGRGAGPQEITITSSLIELDRILNTAEHDPLAGVRLDDARRRERDTVYDATDARGAIGATLARLLGYSFVRFVDVRRSKPFELPITLAAEIYSGRKAPEHGAGAGRKLSTRLSFQHLTDDRCRRSHKECAWDHDAWMEVDAARGDGTRETFEVPFDPPSPGLYRVMLTLGDGAEELSSSRRLVNVDEPRFRVGFDVGYDAGVWRPAQDARLEQLSYIRAMATADWQSSEGSPVWVGISAGYARAGRERAAPASWQDQLQASAAAPYDDAGQLVHTWVRHAFLLGPVIGARVHPLGWTGLPALRRLELVARLMPFTTDLGIIDASGVPEALADARADAKGLDPDLSLFLEAGPSISLGPRVNLRWLFHIGLLAYDDLIFNTNEQELRETTRRITNDADLIVGLTIGGEVGP